MRLRYFKGRKLVREAVVTAEEKRAAEARYQRTHPPDVPRISGCCDSPTQA